MAEEGEVGTLRRFPHNIVRTDFDENPPTILKFITTAYQNLLTSSYT